MSLTFLMPEVVKISKGRRRSVARPSSLGGVMAGSETTTVPSQTLPSENPKPFLGSKLDSRGRSGTRRRQVI